MLQPDLSLQIRLLAETGRLPDLSAADRIAGVTRLQPGQPVMARVQAQLPDGRFSVLVEHRAIEMELPAASRPGQDIRLVYVGPEPQLNFAPMTAPGESPIHVSSAGRLIASLAAPPGTDPPPAGIRAATPLLESAPIEAGQLEVRLRQTLATSGLFYESHQAKWAAGEHPLELLLLEPQARLARPTANAAPSQLKPDPDATRSDLSAGSLPRQPGVTVELPTVPNLANALAHPHTLPIIQQQLTVLETGHIAWQGQVWPGQLMQWDISEFECDSRGGPEQETAGWETCVGLEMRALGAVEANLRISRGQIAIRLKPDRASAEAILRHRLPELAAALRGAGLSVSSIQVEHHVI